MSGDLVHSEFKQAGLVVDEGRPLKVNVPIITVSFIILIFPLYSYTVQC